ncbi:MAG: hypothetical protein NC078_01745 [Ruminococcus sp.]|nr:hypothetical protein [Ruminococcus sp.]
MMYIEVPKNLTLDTLTREFGHEAVTYYRGRLSERERGGKKYLNPLKTIYLWATADRKTNQGFYSSWRGFNNGRKNKNYGGS